MTHGFLRVAAATPDCTVGDCGANTAAILSLAHEADSKGIALVVFPELCVTGYTCGDLFAQELLGRIAISAVKLIADKTKDLDVTLVIGFPFARSTVRYNCAAVISKGSILGIIPKTHIPNYGEFYELRHFTPAPAETELIPSGVFGPEPVPFGTKLLFCDERNQDLAFAVEICEDLWVPDPPSSSHVMAGALIVANLSASNEIVGKAAYRRTLVGGQSGRGVCAYLYADAGKGESTTDMVFSGHNLIGENGAILEESALFSTGLLYTEIDTIRLMQERRRINTYESANRGYTRIPFAFVKDDNEERSHAAAKLARKIDPLPFVPAGLSDRVHRCEDVFSIQTEGLVKRLSHTGIQSVVLGLSGGLDSTLALLVAIRAFDRLSLPRTGILAITMPGFGTTKHTRGNALKLAAVLGTSTQEIRIHKAVKQHFEDIGQDPEKYDITYENSQARERTQILMDKANQTGALVIGTGDLSELALGWATYNGDHMSMYAVNTSIPKTLVRHLVQYCADTPKAFVRASQTDASQIGTGLRNAAEAIASETETAKKAEKEFTRVLVSILDTPVSPELLPPENGTISQKTEHIVGPYELHDFFLYYMTRWGFSPAKILYMAEAAFAPETDKRTSSYTRQEILTWMKVFYRRFFTQQFKRSCLPDGPKAGSVTLSPRSDWRMPSDASSAMWMTELESLVE